MALRLARLTARASLTHRVRELPRISPGEAAAELPAGPGVYVWWAAGPRAAGQLGMTSAALRRPLYVGWADDLRARAGADRRPCDGARRPFRGRLRDWLTASACVLPFSEVTALAWPPRAEDAATPLQEYEQASLSRWIDANLELSVLETPTLEEAVELEQALVPALRPRFNGARPGTEDYTREALLDVADGRCRAAFAQAAAGCGPRLAERLTGAPLITFAWPQDAAGPAAAAGLYLVGDGRRAVETLAGPPLGHGAAPARHYWEVRTADLLARASDPSRLLPARWSEPWLRTAFGAPPDARRVADGLDDAERIRLALFSTLYEREHAVLIGAYG